VGIHCCIIHSKFFKQLSNLRDLIGITSSFNRLIHCQIGENKEYWIKRLEHSSGAQFLEIFLVHIFHSAINLDSELFHIFVLNIAML